MSKAKVIGRREFLSIAALATGTVALASCAQAPAPAPTKAPAVAAPTQPPVPAVPTQAPAAAAPTQAPVAAPTKAPAAAAPTQAPPAAAPTQAPAAVATKAPPATPVVERPGKQLIGKLEGPQIIVDPAKWPKTFKEAPALADLVKAGKLPPVQDRVPQEPLVVKPVHEIGKYGGMWRRGFTGPADWKNGSRAAGGLDSVLYLDYTVKNMVPNIAKAYEIGDGGKTLTVFLRRGAKWSDGAPLTADDFVFAWEDLIMNKDVTPAPNPALSIQGKFGAIEKVDAYTVRYKFPSPYYLFDFQIATTELMPADKSISCGAIYAPAHYLKQFHAKYVARDELNKKAKDAKFETWVQLIKSKNSFHLNTELPVMMAWKTTTPINTPVWTLERNPYSIWVDTEGNQLPYIDKIVMSLAETGEVLNLRAIAGEYDNQARHIDLGKLPIYLENRQKGGYKVAIHPRQTGGDYGIWVNMDYEADPEIGKWLANTDFRRALSLGIDRDQINEAFFLGVATTGSSVVADDHIANPGPEYRTLWHTYDPKKANELLDKIGLDKKDGEGYRLRSDGQGRLRLDLMCWAAEFMPTDQMSEMVREHWKKIGVDMAVQVIERSLAMKRQNNNEIQMYAHEDSSSDAFVRAPSNVPLDNTSDTTVMPRYGLWYSSAGAKGKEPPPRMREVMDMFRRKFGEPKEEMIRLTKESWKIVVDEVWYIGVVGQSGASEGIEVSKLNLGNVPSRFSNFNPAYPPAISRTMTFFWKS